MFSRAASLHDVRCAAFGDIFGFHTIQVFLHCPIDLAIRAWDERKHRGLVNEWKPVMRKIENSLQLFMQFLDGICKTQSVHLALQLLVDGTTRQIRQDGRGQLPNRSNLVVYIDRPSMYGKVTCVCPIYDPWTAWDGRRTGSHLNCQGLHIKRSPSSGVHGDSRVTSPQTNIETAKGMHSRKLTWTLRMAP